MKTVIGKFKLYLNTGSVRECTYTGTGASIEAAICDCWQQMGSEHFSKVHISMTTKIEAESFKETLTTNL